MCCKKGFGPVQVLVVYVFGYAPGYGNAIVSRCAPPDLIQQNQTSVAEVIQNAGRFVHFHHKGGFAGTDVICSPHAGEDLVYQAEFRRLGRHIEPICASKTIRAVRHNRADLPLMLGPVIIMI